MTTELHEFCTARVEELDVSLGTYFTKRMRDSASRTDLLVHGLTQAMQSPLMINPARPSWPPELTGIDFLTAEVAAKRRVLARHRPLSQAAPKSVYADGSNADHCHGCGDAEYDIYPTSTDDCPELCDLAAPFGWHPDYKARWRPQ